MTSLLGYILALTCWLLVLAVGSRANRVLSDIAPQPGDEDYCDDCSANVPVSSLDDSMVPESECDSVFQEIGPIPEFQRPTTLAMGALVHKILESSTLGSPETMTWDASATVSNSNEVMKLLFEPFLPPGCPDADEANQPVHAEDCSSSSLNVTILVPEDRYLNALDDAVSNGAHTHEIFANMTLDSVLLHVLDGRFSIEDLTSLANHNRTVSTITGHKLKIGRDSKGPSCPGPDGCGPHFVFPFEGSSAKVWDLALPPTESCSEGSLVYQVTGFLISMDLSYRIEAYQQRATVTGSQGISTQASEGDAVSAIQESKGKSKWSRSKQYVSLLSAGLLLVVLLSLGTGVALWVRRSRSAAGTANSSTAAGNCPLACAAGMVPKELYRLDSNRWSTCPRSASQTESRTPTRIGYIPQVGNIAQLSGRAQRSVQRSTASSGVDTCGLKKGTACLICFESEGDHALLPCGHGGYCGACAHKLLKQRPGSRQCPICRGELTSVAKVDLNTAVGCAGKVLDASVAEGSTTVAQPDPELSGGRGLLPGPREMEELVARLRSARRRRERDSQQRAGGTVQGVQGAVEGLSLQPTREPSVSDGAPVSLSGAMAGARTVYL